MKYLLLFLAVFCISSPLNVFASSSLVITEIMYNPDGKDSDYEWVELYNSNVDTSVTITSGSSSNALRFYDGSNHTFTDPPHSGDFIIEPLELFIIARNPDKFLERYPSYNGTLIKVSTGLNNSGDTVGLRLGSDGELWTSFSYQPSWGGDGNGKSIEKIDLDGPDDSSNWKETGALQGTPGKRPVFSSSNGLDLDAFSELSDDSSPDRRLPSVSFKLPEEVTAGESFIVEVKVADTLDDEVYFAKFIADFGSSWRDGYTLDADGSSWLLSTSRWSDFPKLNLSGEVGLLSKVSYREGDYKVKVRVREESTGLNFDSGEKVIKVVGSEPPATEDFSAPVPPPSDASEREDSRNDSVLGISKLRARLPKRYSVISWESTVSGKKAEDSPDDGSVQGEESPLKKFYFISILILIIFFIFNPIRK